MACSSFYNHPIVLNIYYVDRPEDEVAENLSTSFSARVSIYNPVIQVRATREETFASVMYRAQMLLHNPNGFPLATGYFPYDFMYNGHTYNIQQCANMPISQVLTDPRTNLIILKGSFTMANCCCLNPCIIGCLGSAPAPPAAKYVMQVMHR
jgi:hypothetical protein